MLQDESFLSEQRGLVKMFPDKVLLVVLASASLTSPSHPLHLAKVRREPGVVKAKPQFTSLGGLDLPNGQRDLVKVPQRIDLES